MTMGAIAQAIEHMRDEKRKRTKEEASTRVSSSPAYVDVSTDRETARTSRAESSSKMVEDNGLPLSPPPSDDEGVLDTPPPTSDMTSLTNLLAVMSMEDAVGALSRSGCHSVQSLLDMSSDSLNEIEDLPKSHKDILRAVISTLTPYVKELVKTGEDIESALIADEGIVETLREISQRVRSQQRRSKSPPRPKRGPSRPDLIADLRKSSSNANMSPPRSNHHNSSDSLSPPRARRGSVHTALVMSAAQRSASRKSLRKSEEREQSKIAIGKVTNHRVLNIKEAEKVKPRARGDSHSPYIRASLVRAPKPGFDTQDGISRVYNLKREVHVKYNINKARFENAPAGMELHFNRQFGVPLKQCPAIHVDGYKEKIPAVLVMMKNEMLNRGALETTGIFRLAPERSACARAKEQINHGTFEGCDDVNIMANLIKVWFRDLPEKLLNAAPPSAIDHTARVGEAGAQEFVDKMREPEKSVLLWLLDMMADIVLAKRKTRMDARNMAIVLAPNLYQPTDEEPMAAMARMSKVVQSMHTLLKWRIKENNERNNE